MALDKLVDSTQLDADLTSVADAIRAKGGTSSQLAFPAEFVQAIEDIPSGGGEETWYSALGQLYKANMVIPDGSAMRYVREHFSNATHLVSFIQQYGTPSLDSDYGLFRQCTALETLWVARATFGNYCFEGCNALKNVTLGRIGLAVTSFSSSAFNGYNTKIETITCYVNATDMSGVPSAVKDRILPQFSPNAVVTFLNYQTGDLIGTMTNA